MTNNFTKPFPGCSRLVSVRCGGFARVAGSGLVSTLERFSRRSASACLCLCLYLWGPLPLHLSQQLFTNLKYTFPPLFLCPSQCVCLYIVSFFTVLILLGGGLGFPLTHFLCLLCHTACFRVPQGMYLFFLIVFLFVDLEKLCQDPFLFLYFTVLSSVYVIITFFLILLTFSFFCNRFCLTHFCVCLFCFSPRAGGFPTVCIYFFLLFFYMLMLNRLIKTFLGGFWLAGLSLLWLALVVLNFVWICKVKSRK